MCLILFSRPEPRRSLYNKVVHGTHWCRCSACRQIAWAQLPRMPPPPVANAKAHGPAVRILVRCQRPAWCASLQDAWQYARPTHGGRSLRADSHAHLPLSVRGPWVDCAPRMVMRSASLYGVPAPQCLCASRPLVPGASAPAAHWSLHLVIAYCNAASWLYVAHAQCKTACPAFIASAALTRPEVMGTGGRPGRM